MYGQVASSSTCESDSLPVTSAVQSTKILQEPIQTTKKIFPHIGTTHLYALPSAVALPL